MSSNFLPYPPGEGVIKIDVITNLVVEPKMQNMNHIRIRLNPKDELSISKIEEIQKFGVEPKGSLQKKKPEIYWSFTNKGYSPSPQ